MTLPPRTPTCHHSPAEDPRFMWIGWSDRKSRASAAPNQASWTDASTECGSIRSRIRSLIPWQELAVANAWRTAARPSSESRSRICRTAPMNSSAFSTTWNRSACSRHSGIAVATIGRPEPIASMILVGLHDPVERVVDPVGNQRDVKSLVVPRQVLLRAPAQGVHVGAGQKPGTRSHQGSATGFFTRPTTMIEAFGNVRADLVHQLPIDPVLQRTDVAQIGARQVREIRAAARPAA